MLHDSDRPVVFPLPLCSRCHLKWDAQHAWSIINPYYLCPWTLDKNPNVAQQHDGGKWICGLAEIGDARPLPAHAEDRCVVYSFGSHAEDAFEREVHERTRGACEIHIFDPTSPPPPKLRGATAPHPSDEPYRTAATFHALGIGITASQIGFPTATLANIITALGHKHIDLLKIDVEGHEFGVLTELDWASLPARVGQIELEVHPRKSHTADYLDALLTKLENAGFRLISVEPVTWGNSAQAEIALVHKDWSPAGWMAPRE